MVVGQMTNNLIINSEWNLRVYKLNGASESHDCYRTSLQIFSVLFHYTNGFII